MVMLQTTPLDQIQAEPLLPHDIIRENAGNLLRGFVRGEAQPRMVLQTDRLQFGAGGSSAVDVVIRRRSADVIGLDDGDTWSVRTAFELRQVTASYTLQWSDPSAARTLTIPDPGGNDTFAMLGLAQTFSGAKTFSGDVLITTANGIDVNPGSDVDADLITVGVTGTPRMYWDESEDAHRFTNRLVVDGRAAIGSGWSTFNSSTLLEFKETLTTTGNPSVQSLVIVHELAKTTVAFQGELRGISNTVQVDATNTQDWNLAFTSQPQLYNALFTVSIETGATGTINGAAGLWARAVVSAATLSDYAGVLVTDATGAGALTTQYGILIRNLTKGTTDYGLYIAGADTYAIWVDAGVSRLDGILQLGLAGNTTGVMNFQGITSGVVTLQVASVAGTYTMTLPTAVAAAGQQLTDAAGNGVLSWAAAGSLREHKNVLGLVDPKEALATILGLPVYRFKYKSGKGTGDYDTEYVGVMASDAPWAMHFGNTIVNPVNALGYSILGLQALAEEITLLRARTLANEAEPRFSTLEERVQAQDEAIRILKEEIKTLKGV